MHPPTVFAIDLGTSGPKVALVSVTGRVLASEVEPTPVIHIGVHGAEQDPEAWWTAIVRATRRLLTRHAGAAQAVVGVGVTAQWSGTVAVDRTGRHLANAIIWMDARGARYVHAITGGRLRVEGYGAERLAKWLRLTGGIPSHSGKDPTAHILFLRHEHPAIYARAYKFLEPKDYLNLRLTGLFAASYDSITLHWVTDNRRIDAIDYDADLLTMATLDRARLPDLRRASDILGPLQPAAAQALGLPAGLPVIMGTPDLHSAAIGSGAVRDYAPHLYVGTSSWLTCHLPFKKTDVRRNMASLPSAIPGRYFVVNEQETAGACLAFMRDNLLFADDELGGQRPAEIYSLFDQAAARIPAGSERLIFTPWLNGERTPVDDHTLRGGFFNLSLRHTRAHLLRAVLEGVAFNSRWLLQGVEHFVRRRLDDIHFIGGGAQSALWCQIMADVLDRAIHQAADPLAANARGVGLLTAAALGYGSLEALADHVAVERVYTPNPAHRATYDTLFEVFLALYQQQRRLYARLNQAD